jgi:hypothetical protein
MAALNDPKQSGKQSDAPAVLSREEEFLIAANDAPIPTGWQFDKPGFDWHAIPDFTQQEKSVFLQQWLDDGTADAISYSGGNGFLSDAGKLRAENAKKRLQQLQQFSSESHTPAQTEKHPPALSKNASDEVQSRHLDVMSPDVASGENQASRDLRTSKGDKSVLSPAAMTPTVEPSLSPSTPAKHSHAWTILNLFNTFISHPVISGIIVVVVGGFLSIWVYRDRGWNLMDPSTSRDTTSPYQPQQTAQPATQKTAPIAPPLVVAPPPVPPPVLADISVNNGPLKGQESRASGNFTIIQPTNGKARVVWHIEGVSAPQQVKFALVRDKSGGLINFDDLILDGLHDGSVTPYYGGDNIYVARVAGAVTPFKLRAYPSD